MATDFHRSALDRLSDKALVELYRRGSEEARDMLLDRYEHVVRIKSVTYSMQGADRADMMQEGRVGLYNAIRQYRADRGCAFSTYVDTCVTNQMITAMQASNRRKHQPMNQAVMDHDLGADETQGGWYALCEGITDCSPEEIFVAAEAIKEFDRELREFLSPFEWAMYTGFFVQGKSYELIAEKNGCTPKSVDNGLVRVKRKILEFLRKRDKYLYDLARGASAP